MRKKRIKKGKQRKQPKKKIEKEPVEIIVTPFGILAFHKGKLIKKEIWENAEKYLEYQDYLKKFKSKIGIRAKQEIKTVLNEEKLNELAKKAGVKFNFQKFMIEITKAKIKHGFSKDKLIIQAVNMLDEITKMINMFYERLSEWYGLYYPEKVEEIKSSEEFAKIVGEKRETQSMGAELEDEDLEMIKKTGEEMKSLISFKEKLTNYIEKLMEEVAPNTAKVAGAILGAKLIAIAGGLKKLAEMPSSTIQVLGAEKALFRHIRKGTNPPKHGVILIHEFMKKAKKSDRGKLARLLASKISISAKVDYYSNGKEKMWEKLIEEINKKLKSM